SNRQSAVQTTPFIGGSSARQRGRFNPGGRASRSFCETGRCPGADRNALESRSRSTTANFSRQAAGTSRRLRHIMKTRIQFLVIVITFLFLGLLPKIQAIIPAPGGCYGGFTTAEGCNALNSVTSGAGNTGLGWYSLYADTTGSH